MAWRGVPCCVLTWCGGVVELRRSVWVGGWVGGEEGMEEEEEIGVVVNEL